MDLYAGQHPEPLGTGEVSRISATEPNVDKRVLLLLLTIVTLLPTAVVAAQTQSSEQSNDARQQASSHSERQGHATDSDENTSAEGDGGGAGSGQQEDSAGGVQQKNLLAAQKPDQILSSSLIGMTVSNKAQSIGSIKTLILDKNYKVIGFVVDMSGMTGLIQKSLGIKWQAVKDVDLEKGVVLVDVNSNQLQDIRTFTTQKELQEEKESQDSSQ